MPSRSSGLCFLPLFKGYSLTNIENTLTCYTLYSLSPARLPLSPSDTLFHLVGYRLSSPMRMEAVFMMIAHSLRLYYCTGPCRGGSPTIQADHWDPYGV